MCMCVCVHIFSHLSQNRLTFFSDQRQKQMCKCWCSFCALLYKTELFFYALPQAALQIDLIDTFREYFQGLQDTAIFNGFCIFTAETHRRRSPWVGGCPSDQVARSPWSMQASARNTQGSFAEPGLKKVWKTGQDITITSAVCLDGSILPHTCTLRLLQKHNRCSTWKYCPPIRALTPGTTSEADKEGFGVSGQPWADKGCRVTRPVYTSSHSIQFVLQGAMWVTRELLVFLSNQNQVHRRITEKPKRMVAHRSQFPTPDPFVPSTRGEEGVFFKHMTSLLNLWQRHAWCLAHFCLCPISAWSRLVAKDTEKHGLLPSQN